ncbi:long-chain-fatty-acid--CoA ligase [Aquimarina longa]|uniref:long-chain-fatty-acid--CoA ligase n=1 Tax=Aquimarina longa TaxID=1080221 RepID=UPI0007842970|nr:long-chain-fatty-acid--CoA ligase [Aquimarina longa]
MKNIEPQTLAEVSFWQAQNNPDSIAFIFENRAVTFHQFDAHANQIANGLLIENIKKESRVAYLAKDSDYGYEIFFGCVKSRSVLTPINWKLSAEEVLFILNNSEAEILFVSKDFFSVIEEIKNKLTTVSKIIACDGNHPEWTNYMDWRSQQKEKNIEFAYTPEDVVVQIYTSGTTGLPKGVQLSNHSFFGVIQQMKLKGDDWMSLSNQDRLLLSLPIFHIGGLWWAVQGFIVGGLGVILETFVAWKALEIIAKNKITKIAMVPAMIQFMLAEPSCKETDFSSISGLLYGGSPITPSLMRIALETFNCDFFQVYGMTETGNMAVCLRPEDHTMPWTEKMKSAGKPLPGVMIKVIDQYNNKLSVNMIGEICIKSPANMIGYWKNEEANRSTYVDGWIYTGDAGYICQNGYVYICDRIKDMIICAGENIYPAEIEAALSTHELISEVAVIGIPDEKWGEKIKAFVVLKPESTIKKRELIMFLKGKIADFKIPNSISFAPSLPRNPSGKILKRVLKEPFWKGKERLVN